MNSICLLSKLPLIAVTCLFCAVSSTAQSGMVEWEAHIKKGIAAYEAGDHKGAAASLAAAVKEAEALNDSGERLALTLNILGGQYVVRGDPGAAEPLLKRALAIRTKYLEPEHPDVGRTQNNLAMVYMAQSKYEEAETLLKDAVTVREQRLSRDHPFTAALLHNLAMLYNAQGKYVQAEPLFRRSIAMFAKASDAKNLAIAKSNLETMYTKMTAETNEPASMLSFKLQSNN